MKIRSTPAMGDEIALPLTTLIGREREVEESCRLLRRPEVRLLTISGPGGVGKTRVAMEVATLVQNDFADGVCLVQLASLQDVALVLPTIAQAFQLQGSGTLGPLDHLKTYLRKKQLLLVLDNFEHVIDVAPLLVRLLMSCPSLKILTTSREVLHVRGERELSLMPLSLPEPGVLLKPEIIVGYGAVALFVERTQEVLPAFRLTDENAPLIAEICQRL
ncbi:MAG: AAA family ATPase, partial [Ktedonobacteraceae bacterium]|nr:AAA family ATPase [Ktedonobacteraceae bacterium]